MRGTLARLTIALIVLVQVVYDLTHAISGEILGIHREYPALVHVVCTSVTIGDHHKGQNDIDLPISVHIVSSGILAIE
jgi:hypothetical protein